MHNNHAFQSSTLEKDSLSVSRKTFSKYYWQTFKRWSQWVGMLKIGSTTALGFLLMAELTKTLEPFSIRMIVIIGASSIFAGLGGLLYAKIVMFDIRQMMQKENK